MDDESGLQQDKEQFSIKDELRLAIEEHWGRDGQPASENQGRVEYSRRQSSGVCMAGAKVWKDIAEARSEAMDHGFAWPDQIQGAITLTYDDGLPIHWSLVGPLLRQYGIRATFYPMIQSDLRLHPDRWRELAAAGHELGNHTVFHPCRQSAAKPYAWLDGRYDLGGYSPAQLRAELEVANLVLQLLDGETQRSYGNTCCDTSFGRDEQPIESLLTDLFVAARGALTNRIAQPAEGLNLYDIGCVDVAGRSLDDLKSLSEQTQATRGWAVFMIHGIGAGTHDLYLDADTHVSLIRWLAQQKAIWTAPVRVIAHYVQEQRLKASEDPK